jgi:hypothetical protein
VSAKILPFPPRVWKADPLPWWAAVILACGYLLCIAGLVVGAYVMRDSPRPSPSERRL